MPYKNKDKRRSYQSRWCKDNTKGIYLKLSKTTDADIISWLSDCTNKQGYLKELIRADMKDKIITAKGNNGTMTIDTRALPIV